MSAVLVLAGVLSPLDLPVIDLANFIGYVLWSVWLVVFAILLLSAGPAPATAAPARATLRTAEGDEHHGTLDVPPARTRFRG